MSVLLHIADTHFGTERRSVVEAGALASGSAVAAVASAGAAVVAGSAISKLTVVPCPGALFSSIAPPMASTRRRHTASPRPVPAWWRPLSRTCTKGSKTSCWRAGSMPMP